MADVAPPPTAASREAALREATLAQLCVQEAANAHAPAPAYDRHYLLAVDDPARHEAQQRLLNLFKHAEPRLPSLDFQSTECGEAVAALHTGTQLYGDRSRDLLALAFLELNQYVSPSKRRHREPQPLVAAHYRFTAAPAVPPPAYAPLSYRSGGFANVRTANVSFKAWLCSRAQRRSEVGLANGGPVTFRELKLEPATTSQWRYHPRIGRFCWSVVADNGGPARQPVVRTVATTVCPAVGRVSPWYCRRMTPP